MPTNDSQLRHDVASEDGAVHFYDDVYGQDRGLERLLGLRPIVARQRRAPSAGALITRSERVRYPRG